MIQILLKNTVLSLSEILDLSFNPYTTECAYIRFWPKFDYSNFEAVLSFN